MVKCKNCGFNPNLNKPKQNARVNKIETLMSLYSHFNLNHYNGNLNINDIWDDLVKKLKNYNSTENNNTVALHSILKQIEKPPHNKIIELIKQFK